MNDIFSIRSNLFSVLLLSLYCFPEEIRSNFLCFLLFHCINFSTFYYLFLFDQFRKMSIQILSGD